MIQANLNRARLGDATSEVVISLEYSGAHAGIWYSTVGGEMLSFYEFSWLERGGCYYCTSSIFNSDVSTGGDGGGDTTRAILVSLK